MKLIMLSLHFLCKNDRAGQWVEVCFSCKNSSPSVVLFMTKETRLNSKNCPRKPELSLSPKHFCLIFWKAVMIWSHFSLWILFDPTWMPSCSNPSWNEGFSCGFLLTFINLGVTPSQWDVMLLYSYKAVEGGRLMPWNPIKRYSYITFLLVRYGK